MRKVLLATAAVAVLGLSATGASADYWATANINYGNVGGDLTVGYAYLDDESSMSVGNMGALTVNDNEENVNVKIKGPVVEINVDQDATNRNRQLTRNTMDITNEVDADAHADADANAGALAAAGALGVVIAYEVEDNDRNDVADADADARARAGALAGAHASAVQDDFNVTQSNDNENFQAAANFSAIYVEDQLGGLLDCGCSSDEFYTLNINKGYVGGDLYAHKLNLDDKSSVSVGNIGAATINKSVNNMDIRVGRSHGPRVR